MNSEEFGAAMEVVVVDRAKRRDFKNCARWILMAGVEVWCGRSESADNELSLFSTRILASSESTSTFFFDSSLSNFQLPSLLIYILYVGHADGGFLDFMKQNWYSEYRPPALPW